MRHEGIWREYRPTYMDGWGACKRVGDLVRCRDCENSHMTDDGKFCKWCSVMATHEIDTNSEIEPPNGYDPEPYFDADFFCGFGKARSEQ